MNSTLSSWEKSDTLKYHAWETYESVWQDIDDKDFRSCYDLKKVPVSVYRKVMQDIFSQATSISGKSIQSEMVVDAIKLMEPSLSK